MTQKSICLTTIICQISDFPTTKLCNQTTKQPNKKSVWFGRSNILKRFNQTQPCLWPWPLKKIPTSLNWLQVDISFCIFSSRDQNKKIHDSHNSLNRQPIDQPAEDFAWSCFIPTAVTVGRRHRWRYPFCIHGHSYVFQQLKYSLFGSDSNYSWLS